VENTDEPQLGQYEKCYFNKVKFYVVQCNVLFWSCHILQFKLFFIVSSAQTPASQQLSIIDCPFHNNVPGFNSNWSVMIFKVLSPEKTENKKN